MNFVSTGTATVSLGLTGDGRWERGARQLPRRCAPAPLELHPAPPRTQAPPAPLPLSPTPLQALTTGALRTLKNFSTRYPRLGAA
jgi:hypothetical protein